MCFSYCEKYIFYVCVKRVLRFHAPFAPFCIKNPKKRNQIKDLAKGAKLGRNFISCPSVFSRPFSHPPTYNPKP